MSYHTREDVPRRQADRRLRLGVLITLAEIGYLRDPATARHGAAVAAYARALAVELGFDEHDCFLVHTAGLLHDIGKMALPEQALHANELSPEEWSIVRSLPQHGADLLGRLDGYGGVAEIILHHHEHFDGSGYPLGLIGEEIPPLARLLAVANVFDVLTAPDSYRRPVPMRAALTELRRVAGSQLDEYMVERFDDMLTRDGVPELASRADFHAELRRAREVSEVLEQAA